MTETTLMGLTKDLYNPSFKEHLLSQFGYMLNELERDAVKTGAKINWATFEMSVSSDSYDMRTITGPDDVEYMQHWRVNVDATKPV